jgi:hypothetical protein
MILSEFESIIIILIIYLNQQINLNIILKNKALYIFLGLLVSSLHKAIRAYIYFCIRIIAHSGLMSILIWIIVHFF